MVFVHAIDDAGDAPAEITEQEDDAEEELCDEEDEEEAEHPFVEGGHACCRSEGTESGEEDDGIAEGDEEEGPFHQSARSLGSPGLCQGFEAGEDIRIQEEGEDKDNEQDLDGGIVHNLLQGFSSSNNWIISL